MKLRNRFVFLLALSLATPPSVLWAQGQFVVTPDQTPRISVSGRAQLTALPDRADVSVGVLVENPDLRAAQEELAETVRRLLAMTERLGVPAEHVRTNALNVEARYDDSETVFIEYVVTRDFDVELHDVSLVEAFFEGAVEAGANREFWVSLSSTREEELQKHVLDNAIDDARRQAERAASRLGMRIAGVRYVDLEPSHGTSSASTFRPGAGTFLPGKIRFSRSVEVTFVMAGAPSGG